MEIVDSLAERGFPILAFFLESVLVALFSWADCLSLSFGICLVRGVGLGVVVLGAGVICFGGSFGADLTFHSGFTFGAPWALVAVRLMKSLSKKISNEMFGIWTTAVNRRRWV